MDKAELNINDLPEPYRTIAEICGIDKTIELAKTFSGEQVYFPKYDTVYRPLRDKKILEEFNGYNFRTLAKKYGLTEMAVRRICADVIAVERGKPIEGQMSIFDYATDEE